MLVVLAVTVAVAVAVAVLEALRTAHFSCIYDVKLFCIVLAGLAGWQGGRE